MLALLQSRLVPSWMGDNAFLAGYGAAQALPGPLFAVSTYLGAAALRGAPVLGASVALAMIFLPGLLLLSGMLPFRAVVAEHPRMRAAVSGVNATVVGILAAALYNPLWNTSVSSPGDAGVALAGFALLTLARVPPIFVVCGSIAAAALPGFIYAMLGACCSS